jgi:nucleotide-binding universal stress UspA family protein
MTHDVFGDLRDWGRVIEQVRRMRDDGSLDDHCPGLARLLRYPSNWRIRESALRAAAELERPSDEVLRAAVRILEDDEIDFKTRVLAGTAVCHALSRSPGTISETAKSEAMKCIADLLSMPQPPALQRSARAWQQYLLPPKRALSIVVGR